METVSTMDVGVAKHVFQVHGVDAGSAMVMGRKLPRDDVVAFFASLHDATDAEAICEAVRRPSMRFVPAKSEEQQSVLMTRQGIAGVGMLIGLTEDEDNELIPTLPRDALVPLVIATGGAREDARSSTKCGRSRTWSGRFFGRPGSSLAGQAVQPSPIACASSLVLTISSWRRSSRSWRS